MEGEFENVKMTLDDLLDSSKQNEIRTRLSDISKNNLLEWLRAVAAAAEKTRKILEERESGCGNDQRTS